MLIYLLLLTTLFLLPVSIFPVMSVGKIDGFINFFTYALLGWLALAALGTCPLRCRNLAPWVALIASAHAYWIEFMQGYMHSLGRDTSYVDWALGSAGVLAGIFYRFRLTYRKCGCSFSSALLMNHSDWPGFPFTGVTGVGALITHHPLLPRIIARTFDWKPIQVSEKQMWRMQLICTGKSMVSLPHFSYGALEAVEGVADSSHRAELYLSHMHIGKGFAGLEFRRLQQDTEVHDAFKVVNWLRLKPDMERQHLSFSSNLRRKIRKGYRNGMEAISGGTELLDRFYRVYARHIHQIGSAALPKRFFRLLLEEYNSEGGTATVFLVIQNHKVVGSAFSLSYRGFFENGWFATQKPAQKQYASYVLHDAMIRHAIELGCHTYSFGRSTSGSGVHRFKQQWSTTDHPLLWMQLPPSSVQLRKQTWLLQLWRFIPYPLSTIPARWMAKWIY